MSSLHDIDRTQRGRAGGKGAHLGELTRIDGVQVPDGFCVTTDAFDRALSTAPSVGAGIERLARLGPGDQDGIRALSAEIRREIEKITVPAEVAAAIEARLVRLGDRAGYAVRSSATAEDSPTASFAGQQDSYLNIAGPEVLRHVARCWASLFTERAVTYRLRNGFGDRTVRMAVVVQRMVAAQAAGVLFTADPITGNRKVISIEATLGLGEALVSGQANADRYTVRDGEVLDRTIATKQHALHATSAGGTEEREVEPGRRHQPVLTDEQVLRLARLGRRIEAHFGCPQDIEWCLTDGAGSVGAADGVGGADSASSVGPEGDFQVVQSRPITTLFPIPAVAGDGANHVFLSVGHQQMMTDAWKPLGISMWQLTAAGPMHEAGGRLFVDATRILAAPDGATVAMVSRSDPLTGDALRTILDRGDFVPPAPAAKPTDPPPAPAEPPAPLPTDPAVVDELVERSRRSIEELRREIPTRTGPELFDFIRTDLTGELKPTLFGPRSHQVIMAAMEAAWWLNDHLADWLGVTNAADTLSQSVPGNVTAEMGLALLDVADVIRAHPEVVAFLEQVDDDGFLAELPALPGGRDAYDAIRGFLDRYGMRCPGEVDITRPRWSERPSMLIAAILANVRGFEPGAGARRFEQGRREAAEFERDVLARLRALPDGAERAAETKRMIDRVRTFTGYREYPKYAMVSRYLLYKRAIMREADRLVDAGVLPDATDAHYLTVAELQEVVRTHRADAELIRQRKADFARYQALTPPRVLTSDGEAVAGAYRRDDVPADALAGIAVSAGTVEGRARVVLDMAQADLAAGDILVTTFTDPSWVPVFVGIGGLVTEVGGLMTHGAVIAREYGLPAVVGVQDATRLIRDGQRIRVHGTDGYVELLD
ncbi:phosphoenolpyruvate synthase [Actinocatenispora thailandica]|uniref:phosphoenolpyruvate synthase n=1 Tax=Actinocatenispora thailandica TaxID=227318 RepID=UPI001EF3871E|nr:phosphoenolpyruvate synthase [Actinocatenispora thailandica]